MQTTQQLNDDSETLCADDNNREHLYVVFLLDNTACALSMEHVKEVVRVPALTRVPTAPAALVGLGNLRGHIIPVYSLRHMTGMENRPHTDNSRAIMLQGTDPIALIVDQVNRICRIEQLEAIPATPSMRAEWLSATARDCGGYPLLLIFNSHHLYQQCLSVCTPAASIKYEQRYSPTQMPTTATVVAQDDNQHRRNQYICCTVSGQEYAIAICHVRRIIEPSVELTPLPNQPLSIPGLFNQGNEALILIDMAKLFGLPDCERNHKARILITDHPAQGCALLVDRISGVLQLQSGQITTQMAGLERQIPEITGLCQLNNGKRLIAVVDIERLLQRANLPLSRPRQAYTGNSTDDDNADQNIHEQEADDNRLQVVVYRLGNEEFASPVSSIYEIVRMPEQLQMVPSVPQIEGIINLRGSILPVADMRTILGIPRTPHHERQRILVFADRNERSGFVVDQVCEILTIEPEKLQPASKLYRGRHTQPDQIINLDADGRLIQLLFPEKFLSVPHPTGRPPA
jgi:purine-binding chemotaxis protein CheW